MAPGARSGAPRELRVTPPTASRAGVSRPHGDIRRPRSCPSGRRGPSSRSTPTRCARSAPTSSSATRTTCTSGPARSDRRGARRAPRVLGLGRADPHGLGRVPGLLAARHDRRARRRRRDVPLRLRRRRGAVHARSARPRSSADSARTSRCASTSACRRARHATSSSAPSSITTHVGASGRSTHRARRASFASGSRRARPTPSCGGARSRRSPRSPSTATRSAASPSARRRTRCSTASSGRRPLLPPTQPRYFMGIGDPEGILEVIARGIDMFDCVLPTRTARTGSALTWEGRLNLRNAAYRTDPRPLDAECDVPGVRALLARVHPPPRHAAGDARATAAEPA